MLIRHLTIGGLRSYAAAPQRVSLAPLTLVFGPNSSGKSSLLSVLPMLAQTAARPDVLSMSGDLVEGGSFRMAVHHHDVATPMTLGFGWTSGEGVARDAAISFMWDPSRRAAIRSHTALVDGDERGTIEGPRPWGSQPAVALHHRVTEEFWDTLDRVHFVGPMRARAERTTLVGQGTEDYVGPAGEEMAAILHARPDLVTAVNEWCDRLGLGYHVRMLDPLSQDIVMTAGEFAVLALEDQRQDPPVLVSSRGVGYGVGQLLPIIVQSLLTQSGMILIEQPEVHLHPKLQAAVGDLFVDTVVSGRAQLLVETHSEHLVLRLLRRVREGVLDPDDLAILYVDLDDSGAAFVRRLEVDADGDLVDGWPGGFFDERLAEVLGGPLVTDKAPLPRRTVFGVGISTSALGDRSEDPALRRAIHEELIEDLAVHGRLVFTSQAHLDLFLEAVGRLPTSLAKAWEVVLSSRKVQVGIARPPLDELLGDILDPDLIDSQLADDLELVLVEADQAELLGVAEDEFSATTPSGLVEIGRITTAGRTSVLMAARQVLDAPLREGVNRELEWKERFGPLCEESRPLVIYDKFVGQQTVRRYLYNQGSSDGLTWFLARVGMTPGRRVRIITAVTDSVDRGQRFDEEAMVTGFLRMMASMADRDLRLELVLVPERTRGERGRGIERFGHDRHLRFGERAALALGAGMQTFANATFRETVTVARLPIADAKAREERSMKAALRPPERGWLG